MAAGAYSYDVVGKIDDVTDIITNISPEDTPMLSMFGNKPAKNTTVSSLTDSLPTADSTPVAEGADYSSSAINARSKVDNYVQIFDKVFYLTDTQQAVDKYGVADEIAYQSDIAMKAVALNIENAIVTHDTKVIAANAQAPKMGGIPYYNTVNVTSSTTFSEAKVNDACAAAWAAGGKPTLGVLSMTRKREANMFTGGGAKTRDQKDRTVVGPVEFYESDAGKIKWVPHRLISSARVDFIDPQYFKMRFLVPVHMEELGKKGHKMEYAFTGQATLECRSQAAQACITGIS